MKILPALPCDIDRLAVVTTQSYVQRHIPLRVEEAVHTAVCRETLIEDFDLNIHEILKAVDDEDNIIGYLSYTMHGEENGTVRLCSLHALPHRDQPGDMLMMYFETTMQSAGIKRIVALSSDNACSFYKDHNFVAINGTNTMILDL